MDSKDGKSESSVISKIVERRKEGEKKIFNVGWKSVCPDGRGFEWRFSIWTKRRVVYFGYKSIVHACDASEWLDMHSVCIKRSRRRALGRESPQTLFPPPAQWWHTLFHSLPPPSTDSTALLYCQFVYETALSLSLQNRDISSSGVDSSPSLSETPKKIVSPQFWNRIWKVN